VPADARPFRNRVTPEGDIVAIPLRGAWTGNRGILHHGHDIVRFHASNLWITCELQFRGRWRQQWQPGRYTYLFFHDEAVSFAAGHRPCAECRRPSYELYRSGWADGLGRTRPTAAEMNARLHAERLLPRSHVRRVHQIPWADLSAGAFVRLEDGPAIVLDDHLTTWGYAGYQNRIARPRVGNALVLTPPATLSVLRAGYPVQIDPSAL